MKDGATTYWVVDTGAGRYYHGREFKAAAQEAYNKGLPLLDCEDTDDGQFRVLRRYKVITAPRGLIAVRE